MNQIPFDQILAYNNNTIYLKSGSELNPLDVEVISVTEGKKVTNNFRKWCMRNLIELQVV